ncbi:hypothetical protein AWW66_01545 [Micromonospora rosaria]|uniref:Oligosaccharide repeat unit polymerase n=1 Tax=Micromonospora rosaria TaxID=47874 RepID=A0A136PZF2_9ACTN|nr:hypothetical protein [Micromonospora rosaria]KXK63674.1 hypothetical protein AWW66_01545 [Micromonospora rosaria]
MLTMSVVAGLLVQAATVLWVHLAIGGEWVRRPGALMLLVAVVFHGVTEVMQWLWPGRNFFRAYLDQAAVDAWTLLVSVAIAAYGAVYGALVGWSRRRGPAGPVDRGAGLHRLRMRWLLVLVVPLLAATWQGRGALQPLAPARADEVIPEREGILVDLAGQFLVPLIALAGAVVVIRYGMRWLLPVLLVESLALVVAGTRAMIVFAGVLTVVGAAMHGVRPSRRQIAMIVVVLTAATALISSTRAVAGREVFHAGEGSGGRLTALVEGAGRMHTGESRQAILDDVVYRFDGNTFAAIVYQGLRGSGEPIGLATVGNNLTMLAPSLLVPDKVASRTLESRSEEAYIARAFGLSQRVDWLPTILGTAVAYYGAVGLIVIAVLLAMAVAGVEAALLRVVTTLRAVCVFGLAQCALLYGSGPQTVITTLRVVVALAALMWVVERLRRRHAPVRERSGGTLTRPGAAARVPGAPQPV